MNSFFKYCLIGISNTICHWVIFLILYQIDIHQSICNFFGFTIASFLSYYLNSYYNFRKKMLINKFLVFYLLMGGIIFFVGYVSEILSLSIFLCLIITSITSLILGYFLSKYLVFKVVK